VHPQQGWPHAVEWVATAPTTPGGEVRPAPAGPWHYTGPPRYPAVPRWGFPALAWRRPTSVPGVRAPVTGVPAVRGRARLATVLLVLTALFAGLAAAGEIWRYVLLLASRTGALSAGAVTAAQVFTVATSVLAVVVGVAALTAVLAWLFVSMRTAAGQAGVAVPRRDWRVAAGLLVPGVNLVLPGSVLAELEHVVLHRPTGARPRPGRLLRLWWAAWALDGLLFAGCLLWTSRDGVQAQADGVLLHALTDLVAVAVAVLTVLVVRRLTRLLAPLDPTRLRLMRVVSVAEPPDAPPARRLARPASARR